MKAFVLSGGANYGALQVGALQVLLEHGIQPDMLVGVSSGALNAAFLATDPTQAGTQRLGQIWCDSAQVFFPPLNRLNMLLRLTQGRDSLTLNEPLQQFIRKWAPTGATFGDFIRPRLYVAAARYPDGGIGVFGDNPSDSLFNGLMASTALPPLFPPWNADGELYVDGGVASNLPLQTAAERGADEIFALQIVRPPSPLDDNREIAEGALAIGSQILTSIIERAVDCEIQAVQERSNVRLHLIRLWSQDDPGIWDFTHGQELIADGRQCTERYLMEVSQPVSWRVHWQRRLRRMLDGQQADFAPAQTAMKVHSGNASNG